MLSAFGVDHGEISKGAASFWGRRAVKGVPGGQSGPQRVKGALKRATRADVSLAGVGSTAGAVTRNAGRAMEKYPGTTGTALVGGGGIAGYRHISQKKPKKKKRS